MSTHATGTFEIKNWDEKAYDEPDGLPKLVRASITNSYNGDIEGEGLLEYLMVYHGDTATYVGLERITGRLGDRTGSFVLQNTGTFENGIAHVKWQVVPGTGTGDLQAIRGEGGYDTGHEAPHAYALDYSLD